jgi:carbon-monoxide dehydrogenase large subunit
LNEAEDALEAILVEIDAPPAVADRAAARKDDVLLFDESETNLASTITAVRGDVELTFRNAAYTRPERFKVQRHSAVPMESRGLLAEWDATHDRITVCVPKNQIRQYWW